MEHLATVYYGSAPQMLFRDTPKRKRCGCRKDDRTCRCVEAPDRSPYLKMSLVAGLTRAPEWTPVVRTEKTMAVSRRYRTRMTPDVQGALEDPAEREHRRRRKRLKDDDELILMLL